MNLTLFFRLIVTVIFQGRNLSYDNHYFYCPTVHAKDGWSVSLQINHVNYCFSDRGYRILSPTWLQVEFGFPSQHEPLLNPYAEDYGHVSYDDESNEIPFDEANYSNTNTVGKVSVSVMEEIFAKHGGIDWEKTISVEAYEDFMKM